MQSQEVLNKKNGQLLWVFQLNYSTFQNIFTSRGPQSTRNIIVRFYSWKIDADLHSDRP